MSSNFVMVCKNCKFLSGPYNGIDTWFSCSCGERCFLSSRDIRSGKWRKFNRSTIPETWLRCDHPTVVQVLEPHILRSIRLQDYDLSDNDEEDDNLTVEDFNPERIADELEEDYDSDLDDDEEDEDSDLDDDEDEDSDLDDDEEDEDSDLDDDEDEYDEDEYDDYDDEEYDRRITGENDDRTMEEIDREYEERYNRKRNQQ